MTPHSNRHSSFQERNRALDEELRVREEKLADARRHCTIALDILGSHLRIIRVALPSHMRHVLTWLTYGPMGKLGLCFVSGARWRSACNARRRARLLDLKPTRCRARVVVDGKTTLEQWSFSLQASTVYWLILNCYRCSARHHEVHDTSWIFTMSWISHHPIDPLGCGYGWWWLVWLVWLIEVALKGRTDLASRETQHGAKTQLAASKTEAVQNWSMSVGIYWNHGTGNGDCSDPNFGTRHDIPTPLLYRFYSDCL